MRIRLSSKILNTDIILFLVFCLMIIEMNFFYLVSYPFGLDSWSSAYTKVLPGFISVAIVIIMKLLHCKMPCKKFIVRYNLLITTFIAVIFIATVVMYPDQRFATSIRLCSNWMLCYATIPLYYVMTKNKAESVFNFINGLAFIWYIVLLMQYFIYSRSGDFFLQNYDITTRQGIIRLNMLAIGNIAIIINFHRLFCTQKSNKSQKRWFSALLLGLGLFDLIVVQASRGAAVVTILVLFVMYIFCEKRTFASIFRWCIILAAIIWLIYSGNIEDLFSSFSASGEYAYSTTARLTSIEYFWNCFLDNPLVGIAYAGEESYFNIVHGPLGICYVSDVGIIGMIGQIGIWAIIIYGLFIYRMISVLYKLRKKFSKTDTLLLGFLAYAIIGMMNQVMLIPTFMMQFVIIVAYTEYVNASCEGLLNVASK